MHFGNEKMLSLQCQDARMLHLANQTILLVKVKKISSQTDFSWEMIIKSRFMEGPSFYFLGRNAITHTSRMEERGIWHGNMWNKT